MGLLDILNGVQNGPRGATTPGKGGMSPLTMALLGLLAYKAYQKVSAPQPGAAPAGNSAGGAAESGGLDGGLGGGLGGLLQGGLGGLGGLLAGAGGGSLLNGGLNELLGKLEQNGLGQVGQSWVGDGDNHAIGPNDLRKALGGDTVNALAKQTGMSEMDVLSALSRQLPDAVNHITPNGRLPTDHEMSKML
jgi:uncharacterized protein YidB (DUF937 family)